MPGVVAVGFPGDAQAALQKHPYRHHKPLSIHQPGLLAVRAVCVRLRRQAEGRTNREVAVGGSGAVARA